jgi:tetratricopeptide (TPR) repeat protein
LREILETAKTVPFPPPVTPYDMDVVALAYGVHMLALAGQGKPDQAIAAIAPMEAYLETFDHPHSHATAWASILGAGYVLQDGELCVKTGDRILALIEGNGFHSNESVALVLRAWGRAEQGEIDGAVEDAERGLAVQASQGFMAAGGYYHLAAAEIHRMAKNYERAWELFEATAGGAERYEVVAMTRLHLRGLLEFDEGQFDEAERHLEDAYTRAATHNNYWQQLLIATALGRVALKTGRAGEARERLAASHDLIYEGHERSVPREAQAVLESLAAL